MQVFGAAGLRLGGYGEFVALPASYPIIAKPGNLSFAQAAAVPLGGFNALHFLRLARIQSGETVLNNGAGGSIGTHAIQIAKSMGAQVTAVDSGIKELMLRRMGADHFIDYTKCNFTAVGQRHDVIFDMVATSDYAACIRTLNPGGRYLICNPRLAVMLRSVLTNRFTDETASFAFAAESKAALHELKEMIEDGRIASIVDRVYPMDQAPDAHRRVETEQRLGAVVIAIGPDRARADHFVVRHLRCRRRRAVIERMRETRARASDYNRSDPFGASVGSSVRSAALDRARRMPWPCLMRSRLTSSN